MRAGWPPRGLPAPAVLLAACPQEPRRTQTSCAADAECATGICHDERCLEPGDDFDGDGIANALEVLWGLDLDGHDSDGDGLDDVSELGEDP